MDTNPILLMPHVGDGHDPRETSPNLLIGAGDQVELPEMPAANIFEDMLHIHEYERQRLGQELHDSAGQLLVSLHLSVAHLRALKTVGEESILEEIQGTVKQIDQEIRALSFLHYPMELGAGGLSCAAESFVGSFGRRTGICTSFRCLGDPISVDETIATAVLRVLQEAVVNVHRHAHASRVDVVLEQQAGWLQLTVADNGVGIANIAAAAASGGIGLQGMRHRVEMLHGDFQVRSLAPGTEVSARIPITK